MLRKFQVDHIEGELRRAKNEALEKKRNVLKSKLVNPSSLHLNSWAWAMLQHIENGGTVTGFLSKMSPGDRWEFIKNARTKLEIPTPSLSQIIKQINSGELKFIEPPKSKKITPTKGAILYSAQELASLHQFLDLDDSKVIEQLQELATEAVWYSKCLDNFQDFLESEYRKAISKVILSNEDAAFTLLQEVKSAMASRAAAE